MKLLRLGLILCLASLGALLRAQTATPQNTVIESESFDWRSSDTETTSVFTGRVVVTATNLRLTCDRLEIVALRSGDPAATTRIAPDKPIVNFRLPHFTPEGYRSWLVRGSEARYINEDLVEIKELNLTRFNRQADEKVETMILSPAAHLRLTDRDWPGYVHTLRARRRGRRGGTAPDRRP